MGVSVITTIKNEENNIREFLDSLVTQSRTPDEIIITDGGSTDQTCDIIKTDYLPKHPHLKLIHEKCNIAKGRNLAIRASAHPIIAVTDAGCRIDKDWLKSLVEPLESEFSIDVVGGITIPDTKTKFEKVIGGFVAVTPDEMKSKPILISSRNIAFRKSIWEKVGGYPEWLYLSGEDTLFNTNLQNAHAQIRIVPEAIVYWHPISNFKKLYTQSFTYARGNGQAGLYKSLILKTTIMYFLFITLFIAGFHQPLCWTFFGLLAIPYFTFSGYKLCRRLNDENLFLTTIAVKFIIDLANLTGYPAGVYLRLTENPAK